MIREHEPKQDDTQGDLFVFCAAPNEKTNVRSSAGLRQRMPALMMLTHDARGCCRGRCGCRLFSTARGGCSKEFWQEAVGTCGRSCQLHRFIDFLAEKFIEVGDEILGRTLFYDVTDILFQIHRLEGSE